MTLTLGRGLLGLSIGVVFGLLLVAGVWTAWSNPKAARPSEEPSPQVSDTPDGEARFEWDQWTADILVRQRIAEVEKELERSADLPAWAGEYYYGDGLSANALLHLAPASGFAYVLTCDVGLVSENYGRIKGAGARILLNRVWQRGEGGAPEIRTELIHVPWGDRNYLIAPEQMIAFGNDVKSGSEPRDGVHGLYWMGSGDQDIAVSGDPELPAEFAFALVAPTIRAIVTEVLSVGEPIRRTRNIRIVQVRLDLNQRGGAHAGMDLICDGPDNAGRVSATIVSANQDGSVADVLLSSKRPVPEVGWVFVRDVRVPRNK